MSSTFLTLFIVAVKLIFQSHNSASFNGYLSTFYEFFFDAEDVCIRLALCSLKSVT